MESLGPKPIMEFGGMPVLARVVRTLRLGGCAEVIVVLGHRAQEVEPLVRELKCEPVFNARYDDGMFSSVQAGLEKVEDEAVFVLPVDIPLVSPSTLSAMSKFLADGGRQNVIIPRYGGKNGHPPLIPARLIPSLLAWEGENGLRGALCTLPKTYLETADEAVLWDMDTPADYARLLGRLRPLAGPASMR
jgi:CTP:molybdopterin cytidylyltransferase MocA